MVGDGESTDEASRRAPGLDGIRGVAVAAITLYHLRLIDGGILGVTVFFTLSGYLITSILLASVRKTSTIDLKTFWLRRARRLLPALFLVLVVVLIAAAIARPSKLVTYARQALSATFYVANWATIASGDNYFNRFSGPGPLDHLWSLAIEEQFYAIWPLLVLGLLVAGRRVLRRPTRREEVPACYLHAGRPTVVLIAVTVLLAVASTLSMAWRYMPGAMNNTRAYEGTDTRAAPMLVGAFTAMLLPLDEVRKGGRGRGVLEVVGAAAAMVLWWVVATTDEYSAFLYRGAEAVAAVATAALLLAAVHPTTFVGRALGIGPLRWLGERSYGVYLWHLPVVAFMPATMLSGHSFARGALQAALIVGLAALSFELLEDPIRRDGFMATFAKGTGRKLGLRWAGAMVLVPLSTGALAVWPVVSPPAKDFDALTAELTVDAPPSPQPIELAAATVTAPTPKEAAQTACTQVIHVGDSTSLSLVSKSYIPLPEDRLDARYRAVGVELFVPQISGGRAIVEKLNGHPSAYEVVAAKIDTGYKGCWVFAIGMGDSATIFGNVPGLSKRIDWMMNAAQGRPVLWTTNKTLLTKGPYRNDHMQSWNRALLQACERHDNMRVYDWAAEVQDDWYLLDQIHPNDVGANERARRLAAALAIAFPKDRPKAPDCLIRTTPLPR